MSPDFKRLNSLGKRSKSTINDNDSIGKIDRKGVSLFIHILI